MAAEIVCKFAVYKSQQVYSLKISTKFAVYKSQQTTLILLYLMPGLKGELSQIKCI